jgi:hypothetical protein
MSGHDIIDANMSGWFALALPFYLAVGVILWRSWPLFRDIFGELGDDPNNVSAMILTAILWPALLAQLALIMTVKFVIWLLENLFRLFRHKR